MLLGKYCFSRIRLPIVAIETRDLLKEGKRQKESSGRGQRSVEAGDATRISDQSIPLVRDSDGIRVEAVFIIFIAAKGKAAAAAANPPDREPKSRDGPSS